MSASTRRQFVVATIAMIFMGIVAVRSPLSAQEAKKQTKGDEFWKSEHGAWTQAAIHVFGSGDPWSAIGVLLAARQRLEPLALDIWQMNAGREIQAAIHVIGAGNAKGALLARMLLSDEPLLKILDTGVGSVKWRFEFDEPLPLPENLLKFIEDRRPLPDVRRKRIEGPDGAWYLAFNKALKYANRDDMDLDKFKKGAEANQRVLFRHLLAQPDVHRGKIVTAHGELIAVREEPAPRFVGPDLNNIYTGYIVGPTKGVAPYTIAFTELPDEIKAIPREKWENLHLEVTFHGYFLSLIRFPEEKGTKSKNDVISPYLIGRSLTVHGKAKSPPPVDQGSYSYPIILSTVAGILAVVVMGALLNVWLRRGDRRTQSRLAQMRDKHNPFNIEPAEPEPTTPTSTSDGIKAADGESDAK
jgi:hypothetical protein